MEFTEKQFDKAISKFIRYAITGTLVGPSMKDIFRVLGEKECNKRINKLVYLVFDKKCEKTISILKNIKI